MRTQLTVRKEDVPEHIYQPLAVATWQLYETFMKQPNARELLDAETLRRKAAQEAERKEASK